ncbi:UNVERIFIED_CONTAM: hypothetical protein BEN50_12815 [Euhalothece sp. KZN 001]
MTLYEATRDLHHACEVHAVGQQMTSGAVTRQEWADWLAAFRALHAVVDAALPAHMSRDAALAADLAMLPRPHVSPAAQRFAAELAAAEETGGAAYVLHGAHRSGGRVLAPIMAKRGLPTHHVVYADPDAVQEIVRGWRERFEWAEQARATFGCLLGVMDEIEERTRAADVLV